MDAAKSSTAVMPRHPQKANPTTNAAPESIMAALVRATSEGPIVGPPSAEEHSINTTHETDPIVAALQQLVLPSGGANSLPVFTSLPSGYLQPSSPATASAAAAAGKADDEGASADGDNCIFAEPISVRLRPRVRELNLLLALLQRPREAFMWARPYRTLMLACQNEGFPKMILEDLATCWAAGWGSSTSSAALSAEEDDLHPRSRFMSLCSECLFLYHQHLRASANSDTSSQREASFSPEHLAQCLSLASQLTTTTTTSAAHGGGDVVASELQRCALLLCSIVVQDLHAVPLSALEAAEERLCQMSSTTSVDGIVKPPLTQLPIILSILSHSHDEGWTRRACATLTHTTIASYDVSVLLRRDGGDAPLHPLIKEIFGTAFYALWASLHTCVWRSCTDASLMSVAHNFCMYAYTWPSTPAAVVGMVELVQERLMELTQAARDVQHMSIEDEDGRRLTTAQASSSVHVQGLLESAVAGSGGDASALAAYKHEQMSGGGGAPSSQPSSRGGVDARAAARRYLSMYGFCLAALAYTCSSLEELFPLFAGPPTATSTTSTTSSAMDGEVVDVRDDGYARWLPMPVRWIHVQSNKTHCINLVAQFLDYLCFLAPSPQLNRPSGMAVGEEEEAATTTTTTTTTTNEAKNATQSHFFNASLAVLHALCTNYPQDLSRLRELSGQNVLDLIVSLTLAYLNVSGPTPFAQAILFSLTERFYTAFPPALLQLRVLPADATNHLYASEEEMGNAIMQLAIFRSMHERQRQLSDGTFFSLSRFLTVLAEVEAGVITTTTNGGIFFVRLLSHLLESMEMQGTTVSGLLMDLPEPQRVREVVARLFEGVACLWRQHEAGYAYLYNSSTTTLLAFTIRIITDMAHLTRRYDMCATCLIPACGGGGDFFFSAIFVLLHIAYAPDTSLMLATAVSELLCSTITHSAPQGIFATLRPHTTKRYRVRLSNLMHASLTRGIGSISNRLRLLIMLELTRVEPVVMQYFITLDGHPSTSEAMQVEDLRMTKVLTSIVVREESSMVEKALALDLLRWMGMSAAVKPNRAIGLLQRQDGAQDEEVLASGHDLALTAAVVQYANARMQEQASKALRTADGSGGASREPMTAVMKKIVASQGDSIDLCIRRGTECLVAATRRCRDAGRAMMFEDLTQDRTGPIQHAVYSEAACQRWQPRGAPACATWTQRCARGTSFAEWQREVEHLADAEDCTGMSSTIRSMMPSGGTGPTTATTATTAAAGGAAGASAIVASNSTSSPAVAAAARLRTELLPDASATQHRFRRAFQLLLGDEYCFLGTDNDVAYNYAVSQLEMMGELCAALENLTWMVAAQGTDLVPMVLHRTGELLAAAIRCGGLVDCYTAPMIQPMVGSMVMRALNLASAAASLLDVARVPGAEEMEDRVGINHIMAELLGWMSRHGSLRVVSHGISTLAKVMHSPQKPEDAITLTNAFELLMRTLGHHATSMELNEMNVVVESCARLVARWGEYCPLHVFASITSTLVHRALFLASQHIVAHAPSTDDPATLHFIRIIHCLRSMMIYRGAEVRMTCLLPQEDVLRLVRGFGASRSSTIAPTSPGADYTRQAWHVCWCAVLELLRVLLITSGTSDASMTATGWMGPLHATLSTTPRFLLALGGFGELPEKERRFFIWDVKEMKRCTEVAALIAMQASLPSRLLVCVQQCFCMASTYPIRRLCLCTTSSPPVAAEEVQVMKAAFVRLVRSQLTILMKQPIFILAPVGSLVLRPALAFPREGAALTTPTSIDDVLRSDSYGFDVLQKYITQELRVIRSLSRGEGKTGGEGGTPASTTAPPAAAVTPATTSATASTTRECSQSRPSGNLAETDTITTESAAEVGGDGHQGPLSAAQYRALHAENTQLALSLFMSGAHEVWRLENAASATTGLALTPAFFAEVRNTCDRLQNTLSSLRDDVKKMGSPNLIRVVESMRHQLQSAVSSLQY